MKGLFFVVMLCVAVFVCGARAGNYRDPMCHPLRAFVTSVKPNKTEKIEFNTMWGANFSNSTEPAIYAKRCDSHGYAPAKPLCDYLMKNGAIEFSGRNAERAIACLSKGTDFAALMQMDFGQFSFSYGNDKHGSFVTIKYVPDKRLGGMVLSIAAEGY